METSKEVSIKIDETFASLDKIKEVRISTSFKQNVFSKLESSKDKKSTFSWFTPQLQFAAMIVVLLINVSAILYSFSSEEQISNFDAFAQEYNFETEHTFTFN